MEIDKERAIKWLKETGGYDFVDPAFFAGILGPKTIRQLTRDYTGGEGKNPNRQDLICRPT